MGELRRYPSGPTTWSREGQRTAGRQVTARPAEAATVALGAGRTSEKSPGRARDGWEDRKGACLRDCDRAALWPLPGPVFCGPSSRGCGRCDPMAFAPQPCTASGVSRNPLYTCRHNPLAVTLCSRRGASRASLAGEGFNQRGRRDQLGAAKRTGRNTKGEGPEEG